MQGLNAAATVWSEGDESRPVVLLLHGFGSHEHDLAGLVPYLPNEFRYAALRAPLALGQGGYAWFPLAMHGAQLAATGGRVAARAVAAWCRDAGVHPVGAIGFSQGGALALELLREGDPASLDWAVVLSGFVLEADPEGEGVDARDAALAGRRPPVFWGRGDADGVITPELIARTLRWLPEHAQARIEVYPGLMHSISAEELDEVSAWMRAH